MGDWWDAIWDGDWWDAIWDWHGWEWHGWEALVAGGTLVLALMTYKLARRTGSLAKATSIVAAETRDLARETARTADADQRALSASVAPLLISRGDGPSFDPAQRQATVLLKSVGTGPAVVAEPRPLMRLDGETTWVQGTPTQLVVPVGDQVALTFDLPTVPGQRAVFQAAYTDVAGDQYRRTRLLFLRDEVGWHLRGFALYDGDGPTEPRVINGPWSNEEREPD